VREEVKLKWWASSEDMCEVGAELLHRVHEMSLVLFLDSAAE
jgi:hypothetical protein